MGRGARRGREKARREDGIAVRERAAEERGMQMREGKRKGRGRQERGDAEGGHFCPCRRSPARCARQPRGAARTESGVRASIPECPGRGPRGCACPPWGGRCAWETAGSWDGGACGGAQQDPEKPLT